MTEQRPVPEVTLNVYVPNAAMTAAAARRCIADKAAVQGLAGLEGFQKLLALWRERERGLLASRVTEAPDVLEGHRRKARAYRMMRAALEQVSATGELAEKVLANNPQGVALPPVPDEFAALVDMFANITGMPTVAEKKAELYGGGNAERMIDEANAIAAAIAHPGWRVVVVLLAGLSWAHWMMLGEGVGDEAEHQDAVAVIAAMLHSAQNVLLQGRDAEQWLKDRAGETA